MRMEGYDWDAKLIKRFEVVVRAKNRAPLVPQTNARRTVPARNESRRGARLSGD